MISVCCIEYKFAQKFRNLFKNNNLARATAHSAVRSNRVGNAIPDKKPEYDSQASLLQYIRQGAPPPNAERGGNSRM